MLQCLRVSLVANVTISQYSYLCAATHDYEDPRMALTAAPIKIGADAWVCACVFVGPGVTIGEGTVVGARSSVFSDVEAWAVVAGTPARFIKKRTLRTAPAGKVSTEDKIPAQAAADPARGASP